MASAQRPALSQSEDDGAPYLAVGVDQRGGVCWEVISRDTVVTTCSGYRALEIMEAMRRARGLPVP